MSDEHLDEPANVTPVPDPLGSAAAVVDVLALLRVIGDPAESAKRLDALREAKRAADDQRIAVSRRETELAKRESAVAAKVREVEAREVAVNRREAVQAEVRADLEAFEQRLKRIASDMRVQHQQYDLIRERLEGTRFASLVRPVEPIPTVDEIPDGRGRSPNSRKHQFTKADAVA